MARVVAALWLAGLAAGALGEYLLVVDAGSTGSRMRMFTVTDGSLPAPIAPANETAFETTPGLSSYAATPELAGPSLAGLLQATKLYIPQQDWANTPLFIMATAGMRLLPPQEAEAVYNAVRVYLSNQTNCPFKFVSATTISGEEEAIFGFVAINALLGTLRAGAEQVGTMDLGGASTQVAFLPRQDVRDHEFQFYLWGDRQSAYAKSYMRFGQVEALARAVELAVKASPGSDTVIFPCFPFDYSEQRTVLGRTVTLQGGGDAAGCSVLAKQLLHTDYECLMAPCAVAGTYMPPVTGTFYAISAYFYAVNGIGLVGWNQVKAVSPTQIEQAAQSFCKLGIDAAAAVSNATLSFARTYCFSANLVRHLLNAYGFDDDSTSVIFARKVAGQSADWTLGAAVYEAKLMEIHLPNLPCRPRSEVRKYTLVIDAGAGGSRLRMFQDNGTDLIVVAPKPADEADFETSPGLAAYASDPSRAGPSLNGLIAAARRYIDAKDYSSTQLFVKASAGIKLLDAAVSQSIIDAVAAFLDNTTNCPFELASVEVISGEREAVFAQIGINKLLGRSPDGEDWLGALDLGGASAKTAFAPAEAIRDHEFEFYLDTKRYAAFTASYMRFGQEEAQLRSLEALVRAAPADATTLNHPCFFADYSEVKTVLGRTVNFTGPANVTACSALALALLHLDYECVMPRCTVFATPIPDISGNFIAISAFFYVARGLGLVSSDEGKVLRPDEIETASQRLCSMPSLAAAAQISGVSPNLVKGYCFSGYYIRHLLRAHGFADNSTAVTFARKVGGQIADWTYGAALYETEYFPLTIWQRGPTCPGALQSRLGARAGGRPAKAPAIAAVFV